MIKYVVINTVKREYTLAASYIDAKSIQVIEKKSLSRGGVKGTGLILIAEVV